MKWRVVNKNGEEIVPLEDERFWLDEEGCVQVLDGFDMEVRGTLLAEYMTEFAFKRDCHGNWLYEHTVLPD